MGYKHTEAGRTSNDAVRGTLNLYDNGRSQVNVNAWGDRTRLHKRQINRVDQYGGNVEWKHIDGHSASLGVNNVRNGIPQYNKQTIDANANANLWRSNNGRSTLDLQGGASHNLGPYNKGKTDWNTGINFIHRF